MNADQLMPLQEAVRSAGTAARHALGFQDPPAGAGKSISGGVPESIQGLPPAGPTGGAAPVDSLAPGAQEGADSSMSFLDSLASIEWVDWMAIVLLLVFFLLGLFKGLVWQVSRIVSLVAAWFLAGQFGPSGEQLLNRMFDPATSPPDLPLFLSYVIIFVFAVVLISLIAWGLQKFVKETGMTLYDRLGGAILGLGTGSLGVMVILAGLYMFIPAEIGLVKAAQRSRSMDYSQKALGALGDNIPTPMKKVFGLFVPPEVDADPKPAEGADPATGGMKPIETPNSGGSGGSEKKSIDPAKPPKRGRAPGK